MAYQRLFELFSIVDALRDAGGDAGHDAIMRETCRAVQGLRRLATQ